MFEEEHYPGCRAELPHSGLCFGLRGRQIPTANGSVPRNSEILKALGLRREMSGLDSLGFMHSDGSDKTHARRGRRVSAWLKEI